MFLYKSERGMIEYDFVHENFFLLYSFDIKMQMLSARIEKNKIMKLIYLNTYEFTILKYNSFLEIFFDRILC